MYLLGVCVSLLTHELASLWTICPASTWRKNPKLLLSTTLLFFCSSRQIHHCKIVAESGNILFVVHPIRNLRHRHAAWGFSSHQSEGARTRSCRWNLDASKSVEVLLLASKSQSCCSTRGGSLHTVTTPLFLFWGLQVCPAYSGCEAIPCVTFSSILATQSSILCGAVVSVSASAAEIKVAKIFCLFKQASGLGTIFVCVEMKYLLFVKTADSLKPKWRPGDVSNRTLIYIKQQRHFSFDCAHLKKVHQPLDWGWYWWYSCFH